MIENIRPCMSARSQRCPPLMLLLCLLVSSSCLGSKKSSQKTQQPSSGDSVALDFGVPLTAEQAAALEGVRRGIRAGRRGETTEGVRSVSEDDLVANVYVNEELVADGIRGGIRAGVRGGIRAAESSGIRGAEAGGIRGMMPRNSVAPDFTSGVEPSGVKPDATNPCSSPLVLSLSKDGAYTLTVAASDALGNRDSSPATFTFTILPPPPPPCAPTPEICDGKDNDCDGTIDEDWVGAPFTGASSDAGIKPAATLLECNTGLSGVCAEGTQTCANGALTCAPRLAPGAEICDAKDNDCNGSTDEGGVCGPPPSPNVIQAISAHLGSFTCSLLADGTVRCWGSNTFGQLGDGTSSGKPTPVAVTGLP